jgi:hypothetical protein
MLQCEAASKVSCFLALVFSREFRLSFEDKSDKIYSILIVSPKKVIVQESD